MIQLNPFCPILTQYIPILPHKVKYYLNLRLILKRWNLGNSGNGKVKEWPLFSGLTELYRKKVSIRRTTPFLSNFLFLF